MTQSMTCYILGFAVESKGEIMYGGDLFFTVMVAVALHFRISTAPWS